MSQSQKVCRRLGCGPIHCRGRKNRSQQSEQKIIANPALAHLSWAWLGLC